MLYPNGIKKYSAYPLSPLIKKWAIKSGFAFLCVNWNYAHAAKANRIKNCHRALVLNVLADPETVLDWKDRSNSLYHEAVLLLQSENATLRMTEDEILERQYIWDPRKKKLKENPDFIHPPSFATHTVSPLSFSQFLSVLKVLRPYRYDSAEDFVRKKTARWTSKTSFKPERFPAVHLLFGVRLSTETIFNVELMLVESNKGATHRNLIQALAEAMEFAIIEASGTTAIDSGDLRRFTINHSYFDVESGHTIIVIAKERGASSAEYFTTGDFDIRRSLETYGHQGLSIEDWADRASTDLESLPLRF